ncbi:MAG TPA: sulfatase [Tepidisphaeraceae bacterium]|nr:sulfatase [Tepidisphaeraceae bacterium]
MDNRPPARHTLVMRHLLLALFFALPALAPAQPAARPPNVVLILVDDLGQTDLGVYGSKLYETPNIDRLAAQGVRFTSAYSACTVCSPTRAALLTGKYPARLRITDWIAGHKRPNAPLLPPDWQQHLPPAEVTLAEALKAAGYATAHVGKWHLGDEAYFPDKHGFDVNLGGYNRGQPPSYFAPYKIPTLAEGPAGEYLTDREVDEACKFIDANRARPFFINLWHYAVHTPLQGKKEVIAKYAAKANDTPQKGKPAYAALIESVDDALGKIMAKLAELKLEEQTIIVFTSDNGGLIGATGANLGARAGKGSAYEGGVRVPLIVKFPGLTKPGATCAEPTITPDLYPTLLALARTPGDAAHNAAVDGASLVPLLADPAAKLARDAIYWHYPHYHPGGATPYSAVRARDWRLIEFYETGKAELYNLATDPEEKNDLADSNPDKAKELRAMLHAWRKSVAAQDPVKNPDAKPAPAPRGAGKAK